MTYLFMLFSIISIIVLMLFLQYRSKKDFREINDFQLILVKDNRGNWHYELYNYDQLMIIQRNIPSVPGNQFFKSKLDAEKVGELVIEKLKNGQNPSVSIDELEKLNVIYEK